MSSPKQQAEIDQSIAQFTEFFPGICWAAFERFKACGFTEDQAFKLVQAYVLATFGKGVHVL